MTVRISPHKASKILHHFFSGLPQPEIADRCGINQATVSRYSVKFKIDANKMGITAAAKEYGIMHEVDSLRSLAIELLNNRLTAEEAKEGVTIQKYFSSLGIVPDEYKTLVIVISKLNNPDFIRSAMKLVDLENTTGKNYKDIVSHYEDMSIVVPQLEQKTFGLKQKVKELEQTINQLNVETKKKQQSLHKLENEAEVRQTTLQKRVDEKMKETNLTLDRIKRLEPIVDILENMGIADEKLEAFLKVYQELEKLGVNPDSLKTIIKAMQG